MSTPTDLTPAEEIVNPFADHVVMSASPKHTPESSGPGTATGTGTGTPGNKADISRKKRVGFRSGDETDSRGQSKRTSWIDTMDQEYSPLTGSPEISGSSTPARNHTRDSSGDLLLTNETRSYIPELSLQQTEQIHRAFSLQNSNLEVPRPRPAMRRNVQPTSQFEVEIEEGPDQDGLRAVRQRRAQEAFERGKRLESDQKALSAPSSRRNSLDSRTRRRSSRPADLQTSDIPLQDFHDRSDGSDDELGMLQPLQRQSRSFNHEAYKLVRRHTDARGGLDKPFEAGLHSGQRSGAVTPTEEMEFMEDYAPRPQKYRGGILGSLLKLYGQQQRGPGQTSPSLQSPGLHKPHFKGDYSALSTPQHSPPESGTSTPNGRHWYSYKHSKNNQSTSSLAQLVGSTTSFGSPAVTGLGEQVTQRLKERQQQEASKRPTLGKRLNSEGKAAINRLSRARFDAEIRITKHIGETIARQKYLTKICKALMQYGAPTHRLEEYMRMSARVLETDAQFLYIPGAMIMSFEDRDTHTSEVKLVKVAQGLDLGKLRDVHEVYKEVVHDRLGVEEAMSRLKEITNRKDKHNRLARIPIFGLAAVCVGPFAFQARLIDLPISFLLGCILGILQLYVAPSSDLYANVFEIAATVITSFLARAFGSIRGGDLFCFSALAQSSIALILPGYTVLCASLELQSRSMVAGSIRMVYAIIYSLFLGFGITIGTAIYGMIDSNATSATTCSKPLPGYWGFFFVPGFTMCLIIINQAKWKQAPIMMVISFAGYVVNYFSSQRFSGNSQVANTLGALVIGVMANLYSRLGGTVENVCLDIWEDRLRPKWRCLRKRIFGHESRKFSGKAAEEGTASDNESVYVRQTRRLGYSLAAAAMLPAIFVQVPSGLAVNGSLITGISSANQITGNTTVIPGTASQDSTALTVSYSVIQVAIGITVGLFLSAIVVYPFGKKRSGLFSF
ncbi:unnamed protein product [Zymoseptoria tritici ST99CH_1A5]|uniref:Threonine/serine exporter-like N-terminal domain-containing protein n=1 Tax=Zymoseptoria tritici ST99CH_1A5 TaxID=1276529 RepID=A0A1Y6L5W1_ZYMTR|nr:unnamed protein product [Zymoseptoria tritici ST99CH_1A5]